MLLTKAMIFKHYFYIILTFFLFLIIKPEKHISYYTLFFPFFFPEQELVCAKI